MEILVLVVLVKTGLWKGLLFYTILWLMQSLFGSRLYNIIHDTKCRAKVLALFYSVRSGGIMYVVLREYTDHGIQ